MGVGIGSQVPALMMAVIWGATRRADHDHLTADIIRLEAALNARVYAPSPADIHLNEHTTKYPYGEV